MRIALISCSKNKQEKRCEAREMYSSSTLFKKASSYVQKSNYDKWFILSALYGLLEPNKMIETYDKTLNNMSKKEVVEWSDKVFESIVELGVKEIDFYAGIKYRQYLIPMLEEHGIKCNVPLKGMGIGQQLRFYKKME